VRTITRKDFMALAASAGAGGLLFGALPGRRASAHEGMPAYITNALEHQTYDMFQGWFSWLRSVGVPGYLGEHSVPNSQKPLGASEVQKWLTLFDKVYQILDANVDLIPAVTAHVASLYTGGVTASIYTAPIGETFLSGTGISPKPSSRPQSLRRTRLCPALCAG
jgi:hypothetical protein